MLRVGPVLGQYYTNILPILNLAWVKVSANLIPILGQFALPISSCIVAIGP